MIVKKTVSFVLRLVFVAVCLLYALCDINTEAFKLAASHGDWLAMLGSVQFQDFDKLRQAFVQFDSTAIVVTTLLSFLGYAVMALRMNFLSGYDCGNWVGLKSFLLSMAVNNVAPAKLGELAKCFYLRRQCGYSLGQTISMVFWERFFDLNAILAMGLVVAFHFKLKMAFFPLAVGVGSIWACLFVVRKWPALADRVIAVIPVERLREFIIEVKLQLVHGVTLRYLIVLMIYTALVWLLYAIPTFLTVLWVAGLKLTMGQTLAVFILSALGMAMPSSPGAVGVFEAAVIFGLGLFKVDKELALAIGFLIHMMQYIPTTLTGLLVLARSGLSLKSIRHSEEAMDEAEESAQA
ncbi:lysylphosphatidylglycerol synthase transmembrane domain-containing protein [Fundidesulfovibrio agrisoli]|uniref:lysylphosphatidylglycerol synthase transmembrane domain-containing protein n=1 Tax=Fundidesulfovibrio agrisoli TaxID=2922717 RepID=UPI001FAD1238|nr:lysylphosphatidylglycerol synthase transmembrane domain-containing protein [Fundidesulfovibrio agrisoli]